MNTISLNWKVVAIALLLVAGVVIATNKDRIIYGEVLSPRAQPSFADPHFEGAPVTFEWIVDDGDRGLFTQTTFYPGTTDRRLVKTVYSTRKWLADMQYIHYHFFRKDGTQERLLLYYPPDGSGICTEEYRETLFDAQGTEEVDRWVRHDGTISGEERKKEALHVSYRADGKTPVAIMSYDEKDGWIRTHFLPDGVTPWYKTILADKRTMVYLDWGKKPYAKRFSRESLLNTWTRYKDMEPIAVYAHNYEREDGTREYRQTWYAMWDKKQSRTLEAIGRVEVYAADGKTLVALYDFEQAVRPAVVKACHYDGDGGCLERTYRSRDSRLSEKQLDASGKLVVERAFPESDNFQEPVDERIFQGFGEPMFFEEPGPRD